MRYPSQIRTHVFCSKDCAKVFTSSRMTKYNQNENPLNTSEGWTVDMKTKVRERELRSKTPVNGVYKSYPKYYGRHAHRVVAERNIGRELQSGEVVHHIDENKANYDSANLIVFASQSEHAKCHAVNRKGMVI